MYRDGYCYWRRFSDRHTPSSEVDSKHDKQRRLWKEYLQSAGGLRELLVADVRSVQPGIWNDRWELPWPYVRRPRFVKNYPKECMSYERAAAETVIRIAPLRSRIQTVLDSTSSIFGSNALVQHEHQEVLNRQNSSPHGDPML